jgi:hypothetical protein
MNLKEKLKYCERYVKKKGYSDAYIFSENGSEMVIFSVPNVTAKYPNERATISLSFEHGNTTDDDIGFDVMQMLCFVAYGVPKDRLEGIQRFCSDFNKTMQVGYFSVDLKNETVYFKCTQIIDSDISGDMLTGVFEQAFTMILFYFGYAYEILIELSFGLIGYGGTSLKLQERKRMMAEAMEELQEQRPKRKRRKSYKIDKNTVEEMLAQLGQDDPDILKDANIDMDDEIIERRNRKQVSAANAAMKLIEMAQNNSETAVKNRIQTGSANDLPVEVTSRTTVRDDDAPQYKTQMPSIEMFAQRGRNKSVSPLNIDEPEAEETAPQVKNKPVESAAEKSVPVMPENPVKKEDSESLVQRLRNWTQNS